MSPTALPRRLPALLCLLLLPVAFAARAAGEPGDQVYKYRRSDGSILYTDDLSGSHGTLEEIITAPPPAPQQLRDARSAEREREQAVAERESTRRTFTLDDAERELNTARGELAHAEAALQQGQTPLPGERLGNVGGGTRLAPAYWQRVALLRADVDRARSRVDQANADLQTLR